MILFLVKVQLVLLAVCAHCFVDLELIVGGLIVGIALLHLLLALRGVRPQLNGTFTALSLFAAGEGLSAPLRYLSTTIPEALQGIRFGQGFIVAFGITFVWFAREFAGLKDRRIPALLTGAGLIALALHVFLPNTLRYSEVTGLRTSPLPWGGVMYTPVGTISPWLLIAHVAGGAMILYVVAACICTWRRETRSHAIAFTAGITPIVLFAYPQGILVSRGIVDPPQYYALCFLGLVAVLSYSLVGDAVQSITLNRKLQSNERRWRSLLDGVSLAVLGRDSKGTINYANPYLVQLSGYKTEELAGKEAAALLASPGASDLTAASSQSELRTRSGALRHILWSNLLLTNSDDDVSGTISVGVDITERVVAEKARDEAMAEIAAIKNDLESENQFLKMEFANAIDAPDFVGKSDAVRYVLHKIAQVAGTPATVLIEGETGVGKELVARAIHRSSPRAQMPFIGVNCAALPPSLIESELFGHERGAFTGADRQRQGRFELADGGTILLDEIGEVSLDIQAKLLRVLQEGEFDRVGATTTRKVDVRVIASTNRDLKNDVARGKFREDLYYRLQVFPISVPPLRDRPDDIPLLVQYFVQRFCQKYRKPLMDVSLKTIRTLSERKWPGNVRELENLIERAVIGSSGSVLTFPAEDGRNGDKHSSGSTYQAMTLDELEKSHIEQVLRRTGGQIAGEGGAAQILGLHPNTLRGRMAKLGIIRPRAAEKGAS